MDLSQNPQISSDPETKGFDLSAGKTWIYPENYPVRDYQFNIVQASLYTNTLVCLPTGLGKTFIAAVVMYNFWRWYPCGKVVFLAPTKPLVAQQIFACHNIMGIPSIETIELTGAISQKNREVAWSKKRVAFATPQVFHNDLEKYIVPGDLVKCVVIDEAHRALGKHSYCECIRILSERNKNFRVLALSATPGNKIDNVHEVLQNLRIARVELRDETSLDIIPYINRRKVDIILVPLNAQLTEYKERYIVIMDRHVKVLLQHNVLRGHTANISKGRVFHLLKEFQKKTNKSGNYGQIIKTLNILMTMYHAYELMVRDGLRAFHKFYQNHSDKFWMNEETQLQDLLEDIQTYLGPFPDIKHSCDESIADIPQNLVFGHTKFEKLKELLVGHFTNNEGKQNDTRAIVFVEYRDIVSEVYVLLLQCRPLIRPQMFVGQTGQKQKQQIKALDRFRSNHVNVLISTSIGEEGLDVGEVDLIICFDISHHSPTRLVQRMGRTGRKRDGHIIILVTDGREHETLKSTIARRDSLNNKVLNRSNIFSSLYQNNSRMIPDTFTPECLKIHINVQPKSPIMKGKSKKEKPDKKGIGKRKNTLKKGVAGIESNTESQRDGSKFSMMKFFRSEKQGGCCTIDDFTASNTEKNENNKVRQTIKPSDVKILSCDGDAVDFLTACALINSEKEANAAEKRNINKFHVAECCSPIKNLFNFSIPDIRVLDCLITLNDDIVRVNRKETDLDVKKNDGNDSEGNDSYNNDNGCALTNTTREIDNGYTVEESKFEDLLDDSSKSNESDGMDDIVEDAYENSKNNVRSVCAFTTSIEQHLGDDVLEERMENANASENFDPGTFEDILNETSDDSEGNAQGEEVNEKKRTGNIGRYNATNVKAFDDDLKVDKIELYGTDFQETIEVEDSFAPTPLGKRRIDADVTSSNVFEAKDRNTISVTQAIDEIARINSKSKLRNTADESEDDMFRDESFAMQICREKNLNRKIDWPSENDELNDAKAPDESAHFDGRKSAIRDTEVKIDEYEWEDDFESLFDPEENCAAFDASKEESEKLKEVESKVEARYSDSEDWISVEKSFDAAKKNIPGASIAKKLARVKKCWNSKRDFSNRYYTKDKPNAASAPVANKMNESVGSETSHFFDKSTKFFDGNEDTRTKLQRLRTFSNIKHRRNRARGRAKSKQVKNEFINDEAEVSSNGENTTDESSGTDQDLEGFVSYTQNVHDTTDMHAHYLQTIRSPIKKYDGFVFKRPRTHDSSIEIYSQPVTQLHESYLDDSFCVEGDDEVDETFTRIEELSELEEAEKELERRRRKRARSEESEAYPGKRRKRNKRRNIINYSASSEDETEKLREQIKEESLLLARSSR